MAQYSSVASTAASVASGAGTQAVAHTKYADVSAYLPAELKAIAGAEDLFHEIGARAHALAQAADELHRSVDIAGIAKSADSGQGKLGASVASVQTATTKLKSAADLSNLVTKLEQVLADKSLRAMAKSRFTKEGANVDLAGVRSTVSSISLDSVTFINSIGNVNDVLGSASSKVPDLAGTLSHLQSELGAIHANLKGHVGRILKAIDGLLASLA